MEKKDNYLSFRFEGSNEIGLAELSKFLRKSDKYLNTLQKDIGNDLKLKNKVVAIERGSFILNILPEITSLNISLFEPYVENSANFMTIAVSYLQLKEFLKGKPHKEIVENNITNYYGDVNTFNVHTINLYIDGDSKLSEAAHEMITAIPNKRKLEVYNNQLKVELDENSKKYFDIEYIENQEELLNTYEGIIVVVRKPSLDMKSKWTVFTDKSIDVTIEDEEFAYKVQNGDISFTNNKKLKVDMNVISYPNNPENKPQYIITKVYNDMDYPKILKQQFDL